MRPHYASTITVASDHHIAYCSSRCDDAVFVCVSAALPTCTLIKDYTNDNVERRFQLGSRTQLF